MKLKNNKGLTLIEVVLTVAILAILSMAAISIFTINSIPMSLINDDYIIRSQMKIASNRLTKTIREATAIFVHKNVDSVFTENIFPEGSGVKEPFIIDNFFINSSPKKADINDAIEKYKGWNFITLSADGKELRDFVYNAIDVENGYYSMQKILDQDSRNDLNIVYEIVFNKMEEIDKSDFGRLDSLEFTIIGKIVGEDEKIESHKVEYAIRALSSLQVVDRGDYRQAATVIFYRTEDRPLGVDAEVAVAMVLDISGSMGYKMDGATKGVDNPESKDASRISILKQRAGKLLNEFSSLSNANIALIPFSTSANRPSQWKNYKYGGKTKDPLDWKNAKTDNGELEDLLSKLVAGGGTNVGDGIRKAYYKLKNYENTEAAKYMILLMDGVPTYGSVHKINYSDQIETIKRSTNNGSPTGTIPQTFVKNGKIYFYISHTDNYTGTVWNKTYKDTSVLYRYSDANFVTSDIDIDETELKITIVNNQLKTDNYNNYPSGRYAGLGTVSDDFISKPYITKMAEKLKEIKDEDGESNLRVWVIGFSAVEADRQELNFIEDQLLENVKEVSKEEAISSEGLDKVFNDIKTIIVQDYWHIMGPKE